MTDTVTELARRLAVGRKSDGRSVYDEAAKAELVALCAQPGASVSRLARQCGINANQVWRWMREHAQRRRGDAAGGVHIASVRETSTPFVELPLVMPAHAAVRPASPAPASQAAATTASSATSATLHLQAQLPNGVRLDLPALDPQHFADVVATLGRIRCSASTRT